MFSRRVLTTIVVSAALLIALSGEEASDGSEESINSEAVFEDSRRSSMPSALSGRAPVAEDTGAEAEEPGEVRRDFSASIRAGRMAAPWTAIRSALMGSDEPEDVDLAEDIYALILDLREQRRSPGEQQWRYSLQDIEELTGRLQDSRHADEPAVLASLAQVEQMLVD